MQQNRSGKRCTTGKKLIWKNIKDQMAKLVHGNTVNTQINNVWGQFSSSSRYNQT